jgi:beta-N-acetylhexosaminidase
LSLPLLVDLHSTELTASERDLLRRPNVAGICLFSRNLQGVEQGRDLVAEVLAVAQRPLIIAIDQEGGGVVRLPELPVAPSAMALGAVGDAALSERLGFTTGRGLRRLGVNVNFAPVADVQSNPDNPIIGDRAFGADPTAVGEHVAAFTLGLQRSGVAATLKHFPGHGDVAIDSHLALPRLEVDEERLQALELPPFAAGIAAGAAAVMSAHLVVSALDPYRPATLSSTVLEGLLRQRLGFDGLIFSDALDMRAIADRWGDAEAALRAFHAGVDVPIICNVGADAYHRLLDALAAADAADRIDPARSQRAQERLAQLLRRYPAVARAATPEEQGADAAHETEAARRAAVVLGDLPPIAPGDRVVVFGRPAEARSGASDPVAPVANLVSALRAASVTVDWLEALDGLPARLPGAAALVVASSERRPLPAESVGEYRRAFAIAEAQGVPSLHVALWNPAHCAALPGPALVTFGFRPASAAAAAALLLGGAAYGRAPIPLTTGGAR